MSDPSWTDSIAFLTSVVNVPAASASGRLLITARSRWEAHVTARTSMHDLLFTLPGHPYLFDRSVRVAWRDGIYTFAIEGDQTRSTDEAGEDTADDVLDACLSKLTR